MFDINLIREQPDQVRLALVKRQMDPKVVDEVIEVDVNRRTLLTQVESLKAERNRVSKEISQTKDATERQAKIEAMRRLGEQIAELDNQAGQAVARMHILLSGIPNMPDPSVPVGKDEHENVVVQVFVEPREYNFTPIPHWDLGPKLGIINFDQGVKFNRFTLLHIERSRGASAAGVDCVYARPAHPPRLSREIYSFYGEERYAVRLGPTAQVRR